MRLSPFRDAPRSSTPDLPDPAQDARRSRALFDLAPDAYVVTNGAGTIVDVNAAARSLLARTVEEVVGRPLVELVAAADRRSFLARRAKLRFGRPAPAPLAEWTLRLQGLDGGIIDAVVAVTSAAEASPDREALLLWRLPPASPRSPPQQGRAPPQRVGVFAAPSLPAQEEEGRRDAHPAHEQALDET